MGKLLDAVRDGSRREVLFALRDETAAAIEESSSGRDVAALSKRLIEICDLIDSLPDDESLDPTDKMIAEIGEFYSDD